MPGFDGLCRFCCQRNAASLTFVRVFLTVGLAYQAVPAQAQTSTPITVDGSSTGLTFEGIGAVSAGASSRLLIDYPEPYRSQILDYLFKPNYGANIQYLKVELGGDVDSTDGAEPSHMHSATDLNFTRGYEWWLMQEAKLRNPNIAFGALAWGAPGWIGNGQFYSQDNIDYIINFIQGAQSNYGLTIGDIGIWNETDPNINWIINLKAALAAAGLTTTVVAADQGNLDIIADMLNYPPLVDAIDVIGIHYPSDPQTFYIPGNKRLWATEAGPWRGDWTGAQFLARNYNDYYTGGHITRTEIWSLISSYYDFLPLAGSGLMYANTPWSGSYNVQPAIWATAHTTQFAQPGWRYLDSACGHLNSGSFVTLKSGSDYSIIIETAAALSDQSVTFHITGGLSTGTVHVWKSDADNQFIQQPDIVPVNGSLTITLSPGAIYSLTTTTGQSKGTAAPPTAAAFPLPYSDNFENYSPGQGAKYFSAINGSFEIAACGGGRSGQCLRQAVDNAPIPWHEVGPAEPASFLGSTNWTDYQVSADVFLEKPGQAKLIGRLIQEDENSGDLNAYQLYASSTGMWELCAHDSTVLAAGTISFPINTWHTMTMILDGSQIQGVIDGVTVASINDTTYTQGMAGLGVRSWSTAQYDNFHIDLPPGGAQTIPQSQMTATATSDMAGYLASNAVDGDNKTLWQTELNCSAGCQPIAALPQSITIALGGSYNVSELDYLPRQDGFPGGSITDYNVYVSSDGATFTLAASGKWPGDATEKSARLSSIDTSYVRLEAISATGGYVTASEINVKNTLAVVAGNPVPAIGVLSPAAVDAGDAGFTLTVSGTNFVNGSIVRWNGADRATTFVNSLSLTATISASDIANPGSGRVTVSNPAPGGGSSSTQIFAINPGQSSGTGPSQIAMPFVTEYALNSPPLRNDFSGWAGMKFTVGQNQLYVSSLGRVCAPNNTANHTVKLIRADTGSDLAGGTAMLNMTGCTRNQFVYGALPVSVTLLPGASYYLVSHEFAGGDQWYDSGRISTTQDAAVAKSVYSWNGDWILNNADNTSYVPPNFQYSLTEWQNSPAAAPAFSPAPGTYTSAQSVSLSDVTAGSIIYYTSDGSTPSIASSVYSAPIPVNATTTIQAFAAAPGLANSNASTGTYTIQTAATSAATFSPTGGTYTSPQNVLLSDTTAGATIYYTTDGSTPSTSSPIYSAPILTSTTTTIKSFASSPGYADSPIAAATYTIQTQSSQALPYVNSLGSPKPNRRRDFGGWVGMKVTVGENPLYVNSLGRICLAGNAGIHTVKFVDAASGTDVPGASAPVSMSACIPDQFVYTTLPSPLTLLARQTYYLVSQETAGDDEWYEFGPISTTVDAITTNSIYSYQGTWYPINGPNTSYVPPNFQYLLSQGPAAAATPSFSPSPGTFSTEARVSLTSTTPGAVIYYTLDGSIPTAGSSVYGRQILVDATTTVKAISVAAGLANSFVASGIYTIQTPTAAMPTFSPQAGSYTATQTVFLSDATAGAAIYYTTDGSVPTPSSTAYDGPITVSSTTTINAIALAPSLPASAPISATYTISSLPNETAFVTGLGGQGLRSDFDGWIGMKLTIGSNSLTVTSLGRLCIVGNTGVHTVQLLNAGSGIATPGGSVQVAMSGCTPGQFTSVSLSTPITLAAGSSFYLATRESAGGDRWYDVGSISTTSDAAVNNSIYSFDGANWIATSGPNTSYVPPTFGYLAAPPDPNPPFVTGFGSNSALRNDFDGWVGMRLTAGSTPLKISYLGRVCVAENSATHVVKLVDATSGIDVPGASATVDMTDCTAGQFVYTALPASLSLGAGASYYLVSQEAAGGDRWYDFGSISARAAASVNGAVYGFGGRWFLVGGTNMSYGPPSFE